MLDLTKELDNIANLLKPRGVIGNTTDFGSVIQGSSPCGVATFYRFLF